MMFSPPRQDELRSITRPAVHNYLVHHGWILRDAVERGLDYYEHSEMLLDNGKPVYYYFPATDKSPSYPLDVLTFISSQSKLRDMTPEDVYRELTAMVPNADARAASQPVASAP